MSSFTIREPPSRGSWGGGYFWLYGCQLLVTFYQNATASVHVKRRLIIHYPWIVLNINCKNLYIFIGITGEFIRVESSHLKLSGCLFYTDAT